MRIIIAKASSSDVAVIIELLTALYLELGEEAGSISFLSQELVIQTLQSTKTDILLARINTGQEVGIVTLTECQSIYAGGKYGLLDEMYIIPSFRSKGIGTILIEKVRSIAKEKTWTRVDVTAPTYGGEKAVQFYKNSGFASTGRKLKMLV